MIVTRFDVDHVRQTGYGRRHESVGHRAIADLAEVVVAPRQDGTVRMKRERMLATTVDVDRARQSRHGIEDRDAR